MLTDIFLLELVTMPIDLCNIFGILETCQASIISMHRYDHFKGFIVYIVYPTLSFCLRNLRNSDFFVESVYSMFNPFPNVYNWMA